MDKHKNTKTHILFGIGFVAFLSVMGTWAIRNNQERTPYNMAEETETTEKTDLTVLGESGQRYIMDHSEHEDTESNNGYYKYSALQDVLIKITELAEKETAKNVMETQD